MSHRVARVFLTVIAASMPALALAAVHDTVFRGTFEALDAADTAATDAQAARFLTQATFGPTVSEIALVRKLGYQHWLDRQLGMPITPARPHMQQLNTALNALVPSQDLSQDRRVDRFYHTAAYGRDQLRQRTAWALSQIFVVSDVNGAISGDIIQMTEYWDLLARGAFGTYRMLLNDVTFSPTMGKYLSHFRNRKAAGTRLPDENYAREIMQLLSIGLIERNLNFTPILLSGQPVPTYTQNTITEMAKVFTGFAYSDATPTNIFSGTNTYNPMSCVQNEHDIGVKTVLGGVVLPANAPCGIDVGAMLNVISVHQNVAPFISRQLIQRFVTSSPSSAYIQRVATVFNNNGRGERGDLGAVIRAILLDVDARNNAPPANFGKLREPVLRLTALWRAWDAVAPLPPANQPSMDIRISSQARGMSQTPMRAPTVFNYYVPDFQQPGPIAAAGLFSPEFQITNESTVWAVGNTLYNHSWNAYVGGTVRTDRPVLELAPLVALASNPAAMVELANQRMLYGTMTTATRNALTTMVTALGTASAVDKARSVVYATSLSPEFATQR